MTKTKFMRVVLSGYEDADGIMYEALAHKVEENLHGFIQSPA